jgi:hypothetical protein
MLGLVDYYHELWSKVIAAAIKNGDAISEASWYVHILILHQAVPIALLHEL